MLPFEDRFTRQRRLAEIGPGGQERLLASEARVDNAPGREIEREYLERAGVRVIGSQVGSEDFPLASAFGAQASRDLAAGAWRALRKIREALAPESNQSPTAATPGPEQAPRADATPQS